MGYRFYYLKFLKYIHQHAAMVQNSEGCLPPNLFGIFMSGLCPCFGHIERSVGYCLLFSQKRSWNTTHCFVNDFFHLQPGN